MTRYEQIVIALAAAEMGRQGYLYIDDVAKAAAVVEQHFVESGSGSAQQAAFMCGLPLSSKQAG